MSHDDTAAMVVGGLCAAAGATSLYAFDSAPPGYCVAFGALGTSVVILTVFVTSVIRRR